MPNTRISDLTAATSVAGTDVYPSVQTAGVGPVKTSLTQITAFALANAPAGAVATPSIAPTGDTNTGFWFPAADTIAASTGGSERLRINSSGNVGIGTTPSVWGSSFRAIDMVQFSTRTSGLFGGSGRTGIGIALGCYNDNTNWIYSVTSAPVATYEINGNGAHAFSVATAGVAGNPITFSTAMLITSAGLVGIGTASPVAPLSVVGNILAPSFDTNTTYTIGIQDATVNGFVNTKRGNLTIQASSATTGAQGMGAGDLTLKAGNSYSSNTTLDGDVNIRAGYNLVGSAFSNGKVLFFTDNTERMRITSAGLVGIGTASPSTTLDVRAAQATFGLTSTTTTNAAYSSFNNAGGIFYAGIDNSGGSAFSGTAYSSVLWSTAATPMVFATNGSEKMRITSAGNVGIATTAPTTKFGVYSVGTPTTTGSMTVGSAFVGDFASALNVGATDSGAWLNAAYFNNAAVAIPIRFMTAGTEHMRISSAGNVLIGRTAAYKSATIGSWSFSAATGNGGEGGVEFVNTSTDANSDSNPPIIILKGSTTTSSSARFIQFYANGTTQPMGGIVGNGATNVQFVSLSDARDKENIAPISGSLSKIKSLVPVSFDWKLSGEHVNAGFTAQDVERVFPEFVVENYGDANGEARKGLTGGMTGGIIPHLVKAIQELAAEIAALKAKNA